MQTEMSSQKLEPPDENINHSSHPESSEVPPSPKKGRKAHHSRYGSEEEEAKSQKKNEHTLSTHHEEDSPSTTPKQKRAAEANGHSSPKPSHAHREHREHHEREHHHSNPKSHRSHDSHSQTDTPKVHHRTHDSHSDTQTHTSRHKHHDDHHHKHDDHHTPKPHHRSHDTLSEAKERHEGGSSKHHHRDGHSGLNESKGVPRSHSHSHKDRDTDSPKLGRTHGSNDDAKGHSDSPSAHHVTIKGHKEYADSPKVHHREILDRLKDTPKSHHAEHHKTELAQSKGDTHRHVEKSDSPKTHHKDEHRDGSSLRHGNEMSSSKSDIHKHHEKGDSPKPHRRDDHHRDGSSLSHSKADIAKHMEKGDTPKSHHKDEKGDTPRSHHKEHEKGDTPKMHHRDEHHRDGSSLSHSKADIAKHVEKGDTPKVHHRDHRDDPKDKDMLGFSKGENGKYEKVEKGEKGENTTPRGHHREFLDKEKDQKTYHKGELSHSKADLHKPEKGDTPKSHHRDDHHKNELSHSKADLHKEGGTPRSQHKESHSGLKSSQGVENGKVHHREKETHDDDSKANTPSNDRATTPRSGSKKLLESKEIKKDDDKKKEKATIPIHLETELPDAEYGQQVHRAMVKSKKGLQDFEKIRLLGKGGVGRVYCVRLKGTDQLYAMKVLTKQEMIANKKVHRVLTEREVLATADHPFVANLYYSFQSRSQLCFIMQYCAGGEFYRWILRQPNHCLIEEHAKFYAVEVLLALEYLHSMGYIYRDLKPENILMHASGHIMLTDFDLSKHALNPVTPRIVTKMYSGASGIVSEPDLVTNSFVGTEEYLAPEVIDGTGHCATVDWWTLGILIFEMLFGTTPFRGKDRRDTFNNIKKHSLVFPSNANVSKQCKKLVKGLLHPTPKKRLGAIGGATDIKDHPFFKDVKWQLVRHQKPPIIPQLTSPTDFQYFHGTAEDDSVWDQDEIDTADLAAEDPFKDFKALDFTDRDEASRKEQAAVAYVAKNQTPKN